MSMVSRIYLSLLKRDARYAKAACFLLDDDDDDDLRWHGYEAGSSVL